MKTKFSPTIGSLRVWHIPQIPGKPFHVPVQTVNEAANLLPILWRYDIFQFEHNIKPDYSNASGLEVYTEEGWQEWEDDETGEDIGDYIDSLYSSAE